MRLRSHMLERFKSLMNYVHLLTQSESESLQRGRSTFRERTYSVTQNQIHANTERATANTGSQATRAHGWQWVCAISMWMYACVWIGFFFSLHSSEQNRTEASTCIRWLHTYTRRTRNTNTVCRTLVVQQGNVDVFASHAIRSCSLSSLHRCIDSVLHIHFSCECTVRIDEFINDLRAIFSMFACTYAYYLAQTHAFIELLLIVFLVLKELVWSLHSAHSMGAQWMQLTFA